jgi:DNA-binding transcriptional ArsR family regulator
MSVLGSGAFQCFDEHRSIRRADELLPGAEAAMTFHANYTSAAALIGDPVRALMLNALLDGRALPAGELAFAAGITPQTASSHLGKLLSGGLLAVECEGRHRYFRLAGAHVAEALERLAAIRPNEPVRRAPTREAAALREARSCYNHLAGRLGVAVTSSLTAKELVVPADGKRFEVTASGALWFASFGIEIAALKPGTRGIARQCLDWTEREHHIAGPLGVALLGTFCGRGWLRREQTGRALQLTPTGRSELRTRLGIDI